ncbi:CDP-glycerol glycerophosphotransferase family protein [Streptomyces albulus]|nr:CDP-glycerol glycerophosphotransferase family protein [Streptomyces noursei]
MRTARPRLRLRRTARTVLSPLRVPLGTDPERWQTFRGERLVVAVARTVTSTVRVLDVLRPVLRDDPRVHLVFAFDPTSAFNDGVHALLRSVGARVLPWHQFARTDPDLIVTATENADLTAAHHTCPVLVLPHGVGFHKVVPDARNDRDRLAGVVPDALLRSGRARLAISHPDQAAQLAAAHPATAGRTLLVGDPCYDALLGGRALRATYRAALGIADGRRLIMISSTWRDRSVLGRDPALPARLLAELPLDDYAVALVTHPNIISAHGGYALRSHLGSAHDAGLLTIPPTAGWQATLLAADLLIGDHGSVTFYGAALGTPLLLGAFSDDEAVAGTPWRSWAGSPRGYNATRRCGRRSSGHWAWAGGPPTTPRNGCARSGKAPSPRPAAPWHACAPPSTTSCASRNRRTARRSRSTPRSRRSHRICRKPPPPVTSTPPSSRIPRVPLGVRVRPPLLPPPRFHGVPWVQRLRRALRALRFLRLLRLLRPTRVLRGGAAPGRRRVPG